MITDLHLQNYRSYKDESFEFTNGVNIIVGPNASGKTNLLESILVACRGRSYRVSDKELVKHGAMWAKIEARTPKGQRVVKLELVGDSLNKTFILDGLSLKRPNNSKLLPVVLFEPNHLQLMSGSPEKRRDFLDDLLEQTTPGYSTLRRQYKRTLSQRNALLKQGKGTRNHLFAWNVRLSEQGGKIASLRFELNQVLNQKLPDVYGSLAKKETAIEARYLSACSVDGYASHMLKKLEANTDIDFLRGFTSYGPHRDDLVVYIHTHPAAAVASRGETRTLMLALKLIELNITEEQYTQKPILLLDDVFSELDGQRRKALTERLSTYQTFITTTDADVVVQHFIDRCKVIPTKHS